MIGASPFVGGLRGSSSTAREFRNAGGEGKKDDRGNSKARGENRLGVGGTSGSVPKLREKSCIGLVVISVCRGDIKASHSLLSRFGRPLLIDMPPKPKSKPLRRSIAEFVAVSVFSSAFARALSRAEMLGVEFPRARDGVGGGSTASADSVGLCLTVGFRAALLFSNFFLSITFLKSFREKRSDMLGFTHRDFDCASEYASLGPRSWLMYIWYAIIRVADRLAPC